MLVRSFNLCRLGMRSIGSAGRFFASQNGPGFASDAKLAMARKLVLITGWSGAGKTTTGNFLEFYHGLHHLDGDNIMHRKDDRSIKLRDGLVRWTHKVKSFYDFWFKDLPAPPELWKPYIDELVGQYMEAAESFPAIVLSFSVYRREVRDYFRQRIPEIFFLKLDCDPDVVIRSALGRLETYLENKKQTVEDWWREEKKEEKYGKFSMETYKQMQMTEFLAGMQPLDAGEGVSCDVTPRGQKALDAVAEALGLPKKDIDLEQLKREERARLAQIAAAH
ncbi:unnamed protein product [Effrenium voratum]|nr:unnamed protein product [Effrenium voratum]